MSNLEKALNTVNTMIETGRYSNGCKISLEVLEDLKVCKESLENPCKENEKLNQEIKALKQELATWKALM